MQTQHYALFFGVLVAAAILYMLMFAAPPRLSQDEKPLDFSTRGVELSRLEGRTIVDYGINSQTGVVSYLYLDRLVPEKLDEREVPELRTETSYTTFQEVVEEGDDPIVKMETRIYSQPAFAQDVDGSWKYLEYATTSEQAWRERPSNLWQRITEAFVRTAYAATLSRFSGAGDGYVGNTGISQTFSFPEACDMGAAWSSARTFGTGDDVVYTASPMHVDSESSRVFDSELQTWTCTVIIRRSFLPFDTSSLPSNATVSAATLNVYAQTTSDGDNDTVDYVTVSTSTQATHTQLVTADFDTAGPVTMNAASEAIDSGQRKDITSISTVAYTAFTLNSAGINAIKKSGQASTCTASTGITCLALREGHDATNNQVAEDVVSGVTWYTSEQTGTSNDPYMDITYTAPATAVFGPSFSVGSSGRFEVGADGRFELAPF